MKVEAIIPQLQSAVQVNGGEGECTRCKLDFYNLDLNEYLKLRGKRIVIEIKEDE